jgi:hypothetical protein
MYVSSLIKLSLTNIYYILMQEIILYKILYSNKINHKESITNNTKYQRNRF